MNPFKWRKSVGIGIQNPFIPPFLHSMPISAFCGDSLPLIFHPPTQIYPPFSFGQRENLCGFNHFPPPLFNSPFNVAKCRHPFNGFPHKIRWMSSEFVDAKIFHFFIPLRDFMEEKCTKVRIDTLTLTLMYPLNLDLLFIFIP